MGFQDVINRHDCHQGGYLPHGQSHDQTGRLLELQKFRDGGDVLKLSNLVAARLDAAGYVAPQSVAAIDIGLGEIADNVRYHSMVGWGFIAAQTYLAGTPYEAIDVAIGDIGVGIKQGLARHQPYDDFRAVQMALSFEYSGLDDPGRGQGLPTTSEVVTGIRGSLHFKTGMASVMVGYGDPYHRRSPHFGGTIIGLRVPCRPGA